MSLEKRNQYRINMGRVAESGYSHVTGVRSDWLRDFKQECRIN